MAESKCCGATPRIVKGWPLISADLSNNIGRAAEMRAPVVIAEHRDRIGILGCIILLREQAAEGGLEPEKLEVVAADNFGVVVLCLVVPGDGRPAFFPRRASLERPVLRSRRSLYMG